jgi:NAD-dependent dihydropyrimidine dehydrogenase PreA subunit
MRQLNSAAPIPAGAANPRINPALLSAADAAEIFLHLDAFQSKKVIAIYSQQCHGNHHCLPVDTWIAAFLAYPLAAAEYNTGSGTPRATNANLAAVAVFIGAANHFGKVERLLWITAQARKIHSTVCNDALWCVKESGDSKARGANPLTCKACNVAIRNVCPAHLAIEHLIVAFNGSDAEAPFNLITSSADNTTQGQRFARCEGHGDMEGLLDEDTPTDSAGSFTVPYPAQGHQNGAVLSVEDFIALY